ncbi:hydrophobic/amphiphilic exporter-1, HAE1 family [Verrucomicrobium sp. GAS474]|uniref:efflux RND transporter permease subunit n=1 Tax=Verrucomicrobium sp. GAS474 TaxID=1882831 RepID=UPI00087C49E3|nr:efflux RND transporter permease subunit [Verrucomicrobium sp. GAS474]SDU20599.1 hydrophobic/amphiphilic exporter-1, HAE1 family [Verrucomicrobium sp. GAS474]
MTLSDLSIRRPVFAWMIFAACVVFGSIGFSRLGVSLLPDITAPIVTVSVSWAGASPQVIETGAIDPLEQAIMEVQGVKSLESTCYQGSGRIKIEFNLDRNIDAALQEVNAKIRSVTLPTDVDPPTIYKMNQDANPIIWLGLTSNGTFHDLIEYADLHLTDKFSVVPGVGNIILGGWSSRTMRVWIDNEKLRKYELTVVDVRNALQNDYQETAAGYLEDPKKESNLRMMGEADSAKEIGDLLLGNRAGAQITDSQIHLRDVAYIEDGLADLRNFSRSNGKISLGLGVQKLRGYNEVEVADQVKALVDKINPTLPPGMSIVVNFDTTKFTRDSIHETEMTLVLSAIVTGLVCWAFLGSWTSTLNVLISIPTSIIGTFLCLYAFHFTLNFFTLLGLSLAVGIVVDDAIMVLENISRHYDMGKTRRQASLDGAREITFAAVAASLSVVAIFLPALFVSGPIGTFFFQLGITISCAVLLSLLESITLTPMRCSRFMRKKEAENAFTRRVDALFSRLAGHYRKTLEWCLRHPWKVVLISLGLFALSLFIFPQLKKEMSPPQDSGTVLMRVRGRPDASLEYTARSVAQLEDFLNAQPEVLHTSSNIGGANDVSTTQIFITLVDRKKRDKQQAIVERWRDKFKTMKGMRIQIIDVAQGAFSSRRGTNIEISIQGPEYTVMRDKSEEIIKRMEATKEFSDMDTDYIEGAREYRIYPDREAAARRGVSVQAISQTVNAAAASIRQGYFTNGDRRYDIRLKFLPEQLKAPSDLKNLQIRTDNGELIPLSEVTTAKEEKTSLTITRNNRQRAITLYANNTPSTAQDKAINDALKICREILPDGYSAYPTGASQTQKESLGALPGMLCLGLLVAYMILAVQFNSFVHPITVFLALPFTFTGAFLSLYLSHNSFNIYSGIGILLLMGIAKKNSILLVEFFNKQRQEYGLALHEAVLTGAPIRLRPILMTSAATIAAAFPAALGLGPGAEVRIPLAIVVIGGVAVSTAFSLLVIPCAYILFARWERHVPGAPSDEVRPPQPATIPSGPAR